MLVNEKNFYFLKIKTNIWTQKLYQDIFCRIQCEIYRGCQSGLYLNPFYIKIFFV